MKDSLFYPAVSALTEIARSPSHLAHLQRVADQRRRLAALLEAQFAGCNRLTLELGCGHGHYLTAYARDHSTERCLGVDLIGRRVARGNAKAGKRGLNNLTFIKAEANDLLDLLPAKLRLQRIFMLFPDPWPKARHHKNRMIQDGFLAKLAGRTVPGAGFYFRTDHRDYFEWTRERLAAHPDWQLADDAPWPFEAASFFQDLMQSWQSLIAWRVQ